MFSKAFHMSEFNFILILQLSFNLITHQNRIVFLHIRDPIQKKNPLNHFVSMFHLSHGFFPCMRSQFFITPVHLHFVMDVINIDRR